MIIVQISDTHIALDTENSARRIEDFKTVISDINSLSPAPDVIIHTGDIVHNGRMDEYVCAAEILSNASAPVCIMAGNKDNRTNLRKAFSNCDYLKNNSNFIDYALEGFPIRLIALDTLGLDKSKGDFCEERKTNLLNLLESDHEKPVAVFTHHPSFQVDVGPEPLHFSSLKTAEFLNDALKTCSRIMGIFSGHVHRGAQSQINGVPAIVMPSVATSLRWDDFPPPMDTTPIYYIHRFDADFGFTTEVRIT